MLLRGGLVADGIGATTVPGRRPDRRAGHRLGRLPAARPASCEVIDLAPGSVVCPGFIDAHVHAEGAAAGGRARWTAPSPRGVTTLVVRPGRAVVDRRHGGHRAVPEPVLRAGQRQRWNPRDGLSVAAYREAVAGAPDAERRRPRLPGHDPAQRRVAWPAARSIPPSGPPRSARSRARSRTGRSACPAGWTTCPAGSAPPRRSPTSRGRWPGAERPYVSHLRAYGARRRVRAGRAEWRWGAAPGSGCTPAICGAPRPASRPRSGRRTPRASRVSYDMYPYRRIQHDPGVAAAARPACRPAARSTRSPPSPTRASARRCSPGDKFTDQYLRNVYLGCLPAQRRRSWPGSRSPRRPPAAHGRPGEWVIDLLIEAGLNVGGHLDRPTLTDGDLAWLASGERYCAKLGRHLPGPASPPPRLRDVRPSQPRTTSRWPGDRVPAGRRATCRPTPPSVYGLRDRGRLAPGLAADICVIGPGESTARASHDAPARAGDPGWAWSS